MLFYGAFCDGEITASVVLTHGFLIKQTMPQRYDGVKRQYNY